MHAEQALQPPTQHSTFFSVVCVSVDIVIFSIFSTTPAVRVGQVEDDYVELAKTLMEKAEAKGVKFLLPEDVVVADKVSAHFNNTGGFFFFFF